MTYFKVENTIAQNPNHEITCDNGKNDFDPKKSIIVLEIKSRLFCISLTLANLCNNLFSFWNKCIVSFDVLDLRTKPKGYFKLEGMELRIETSLI